MMMGPKQLGIRWRKMIFTVEHPEIRAAATKSRFFREREHLPPDNSRNGQPLHRPEGCKQEKNVLPEHHHQDNHEKNERIGIEHVHNPHHDHVGSAAQVSGGRPVYNADKEADRGGADADEKGYAKAPHAPDQHVSPQVVGPEKVSAVGSHRPQVQVVLIEAVGRENGHQNGNY
jgi:hypothetical protein